MAKILILGAGKVAQHLIDYLLDHSEEYDWNLTVADLDKALAEERCDGHPRAEAIALNAKEDELLRKEFIKQHDIVVSLLPASMHHIPAADCITYKKHMVTASYVSKEVQDMADDVKDAGIQFIWEMGLDPGIDHMVLMEMIHRVEKEGGKINELRSFTGGLIAPESDTNPWKYKFTWAPRNVVLAGQGTAQYLKEGRLKYVPYNRLFKLYDEMTVEGYGDFEAYANRDSINYIDKYGLEEVPTFIRGTLRKSGYCDGWAALVTLGLTDDSFPIIGSEKLTLNQVIASFLPEVGPLDKIPLKGRVAEFLGIGIEGPVMAKLDWLGLLDEVPIKRKDGTPAEILQDVLEEKWKLEEDDKDMIVMVHQMKYALDGVEKSLDSTMVALGEDAENTSMSRLVGIPLAIIVKLILTGQINTPGLRIPIHEDIYIPALKELEKYGVEFNEVIKDVR